MEKKWPQRSAKNLKTRANIENRVNREIRETREPRKLPGKGLDFSRISGISQ
jgi:hypothetical protein